MHAMFPAQGVAQSGGESAVHTVVVMLKWEPSPKWEEFEEHIFQA